MGLYRKKPVIVEAVRFDGCEWEDEDSFRPMFEGSFDVLPEWLTDAMAKGESEPGAVFEVHAAGENGELCIVTLEGTVRAGPGDWVIQGTAGELYPCKPDIFLSIYDPVTAASADIMFGSGNHELEDPPGVGRTELEDGAEEEADA